MKEILIAEQMAINITNWPLLIIILIRDNSDNKRRNIWQRDLWITVYLKNNGLENYQ